jgi:hypothetical protein
VTILGLIVTCASLWLAYFFARQTARRDRARIAKLEARVQQVERALAWHLAGRRGSPPPPKAGTPL